MIIDIFQDGTPKLNKSEISFPEIKIPTRNGVVIANAHIISEKHDCNGIYTGGWYHLQDGEYYCVSAMAGCRGSLPFVISKTDFPLDPQVIKYLYAVGDLTSTAMQRYFNLGGNLGVSTDYQQPFIVLATRQKKPTLLNIAQLESCVQTKRNFNPCEKKHYIMRLLTGEFMYWTGYSIHPMNIGLAHKLQTYCDPESACSELLNKYIESDPLSIETPYSIVIDKKKSVKDQFIRLNVFSDDVEQCTYGIHIGRYENNGDVSDFYFSNTKHGYYITLNDHIFESHNISDFIVKHYGDQANDVFQALNLPPVKTINMDYNDYNKRKLIKIKADSGMDLWANSDALYINKEGDPLLYIFASDQHKRSYPVVTKDEDGVLRNQTYQLRELITLATTPKHPLTLDIIIGLGIENSVHQID